MKRRTFLKSTISTSSIMLSGGLLANNIIDHVFKQQDVSAEELRSVLSDYIDMIFNGKQFDINMLPYEGVIKLAESYKLIINENKNSIFDIANLVIEETAQIGFDAKELLDGKIPEGLIVSRGGIVITSGEYRGWQKIPELKNYDAQVDYKNPIYIKYKTPISEWKNEKKFDLLISNERNDLYEGRKTKIKVSKMKVVIPKYLSVDNISPLIINNNESQESLAIKKEVVSKYFTEELNSLIL